MICSDESRLGGASIYADNLLWYYLKTVIVGNYHTVLNEEYLKPPDIIWKKIYTHRWKFK